MCWWRIKQNLYRKIFLKQTDYIGYIITKLSKYVQICMSASWYSFYKGFLKNIIGPANSFQVTLFVIFLSFYINWPNFTTTLCLHLKLFSKCISCLMFRHLITSWNLQFQNSKVWISQDQKELFEWNKKTFFVFSEELPFTLKNKIVKVHWT